MGNTFDSLTAAVTPVHVGISLCTIALICWSAWGLSTCYMTPRERKCYVVAGVIAVATASVIILAGALNYINRPR